MDVASRAGQEVNRGKEEAIVKETVENRTLVYNHSSLVELLVSLKIHRNPQCFHH